MRNHGMDLHIDFAICATFNTICNSSWKTKPGSISVITLDMMSLANHKLISTTRKIAARKCCTQLSRANLAVVPNSTPTLLALKSIFFFLLNLTLNYCIKFPANVKLRFLLRRVVFTIKLFFQCPFI